MKTNSDTILPGKAREIVPAQGAYVHGLHPELFGRNIGNTLRKESADGVANRREFLEPLIVAMLSGGSPIVSASGFIRGFCSAQTIPTTEIDCLPRAVTAVLAEIVAANEPLSNIHKHFTARQIQDLIQDLDAMDWRYGAAILQRAAGNDAIDGASELKGWMKENRSSLHPILPKPMTEYRLGLIPFGDDGHPIAIYSSAQNPFAASEAWKELAAASNVDVGVGPWGERRSVYSGEAFESKLAPGSRRTVHLGLDLFVPADTPVSAPLLGAVHGVQIERGPLSFGAVVTLLHRPEGCPPFLTLWGHLAHDVVNKLAIGDQIAAGQTIGLIGNHHQNGGWAPHLHLQICAETNLLPTEIVGVGEPEFFSVWEDMFPPANDLANLPLIGYEPIS